MQYQLTKAIVESTNTGKGLGWVDPVQFHLIRKSYMGEDVLHVIKCHGRIEEAKGLFLRGEAKGIYVYRDLRDVVVSMMNKTNSSFWQVVSRNSVHLVINECLSWNELGGLLVSKYEEMVTDLVQETIKIAEYLKVDIDESLADRIAEQFSIEQQLKRIRHFDYGRLGVQSERDVYDPVSLLHSDHISSGKAGEWETKLSRFQVGLIEDIAHDWLEERGYSITQNWGVRKASSLLYMVLGLLQSAGSRARRFANTGAYGVR